MYIYVHTCIYQNVGDYIISATNELNIWNNKREELYAFITKNVKFYAIIVDIKIWLVIWALRQ